VLVNTNTQTMDPFEYLVIFHLIIDDLLTKSRKTPHGNDGVGVSVWTSVVLFLAGDGVDRVRVRVQRLLDQTSQVRHVPAW